MSQSKIIQSLYDLFEEHDANEDGEYTKQLDEVIKWEISLCRRFASYDRNVVKWRNLIS